MISSGCDRGLNSSGRAAAVGTDLAAPDAGSSASRSSRRRARRRAISLDDVRTCAKGNRVRRVAVEALPLMLVVLHDLCDRERREALERCFFHDLMNTVGVLRSWPSARLDPSHGPVAWRRSSPADGQGFDLAWRRIQIRMGAHVDSRPQTRQVAPSVAGWSWRAWVRARLLPRCGTDARSACGRCRTGSPGCLAAQRSQGVPPAAAKFA